MGRIASGIGAIVVSGFAIAFMRAPDAIRAMTPLASAYFRTGLPAGPNALLTTRGRRTGLARTVPVAPLRVGDRWFVQAAEAHGAWAQNLRASGEAILRFGRRDLEVAATEVSPEVAAPIHRDAIARNPRSNLLRRVLGPVERPPVGILAYFHVRVDDTLDAYAADARRHPVFELRDAGRR